MARELRVLFPGAVYHITFRGNARQPIFKSRDDVSLRAVKVLENPADVIGEVCRSIGIGEEELHLRRRDATPKAIVALALIRRCGLTRRAIAERFGVGGGQAVGNLVRSLKTRAADDADLKQKLEKMCQRSS